MIGRYVKERCSMAIYTDTSRLDWLEMMANEPGGLLLHDGSESGRKGLGLRPGPLERTLRKAIDDAMRYGKSQAERAAQVGGSSDAEPGR
jgi:hypothetical protein